MSGYARVTKFTGVSRERIAQLVTDMEAQNAPPEGVPSSGVKLLVNEDEGTVIFVGSFASEEDLATGDAALRALDPPGGPIGDDWTVDLCKVAVEKSM